MDKTPKFAPLACLIVVALTWEALAADQNSVIILTSKESGVASEEPFSCRNPLYADVKLPNDLASGPHSLSAEWVRPDGKRQDYTQTAVEIPLHQKRVGFYLKFNLAEISMFRGLPLASRPNDFARFEGRWVVRIRCDDKLWAHESFMVQCSDR